MNDDQQDDQQQEQLLGDRVEKTLKRVGGDKVADAYQRATKRDCGCKKRKQQLNRLHESYRQRRRRILEQRAKRQAAKKGEQ